VSPVSKAGAVECRQPVRPDPYGVENCFQSRKRNVHGGDTRQNVHVSPIRIIAERAHFDHPRADRSIRERPLPGFIGSSLRTVGNADDGIGQRPPVKSSHDSAIESPITRLDIGYPAEIQFAPDESGCRNEHFDEPRAVGITAPPHCDASCIRHIAQRKPPVVASDRGATRHCSYKRPAPQRELEPLARHCRAGYRRSVLGVTNDTDYHSAGIGTQFSADSRSQTRGRGNPQIRLHGPPGLSDIELTLRCLYTDGVEHRVKEAEHVAAGRNLIDGKTAKRIRPRRTNEFRRIVC